MRQLDIKIFKKYRENKRYYAFVFPHIHLDCGLLFPFAYFGILILISRANTTIDRWLFNRQSKSWSLFCCCVKIDFFELPFLRFAWKSSSTPRIMFWLVIGSVDFYITALKFSPTPCFAALRLAPYRLKPSTRLH